MSLDNKIAIPGLAKRLELNYSTLLKYGNCVLDVLITFVMAIIIPYMRVTLDLKLL